MSRLYVILDVFTDRPLAGNPLAVVLDASGLDSEGMLAIAREFNLSETVFLLPAEDEARKARLRIFTPQTELPFAGHPTVGTAVLLGLMDAEGHAHLGMRSRRGVDLSRALDRACGDAVGRGARVFRRNMDVHCGISSSNASRFGDPGEFDAKSGANGRSAVMASPLAGSRPFAGMTRIRF